MTLLSYIYVHNATPIVPLAKIFLSQTVYPVKVGRVPNYIGPTTILVKKNAPRIITKMTIIINVCNVT